MTTKKVLWREADRALTSLHERITNPQSQDNVTKLIRRLLEKQRRFALYLGAGCSMSVRIQAPGFRGMDWNGLLESMADRSVTNKQDLIDMLLARAGKRPAQRTRGREWPITRLLTHYDKLSLAWLIGRDMGSLETRDEVIQGVVEPPLGADRSSRLFDQLLQLPYRDIVTTNYDSNLEFFLKKRGQRAHVVHDPQTVRSAANAIGVPRVVYLHGKIPETLAAPGRHLVLDRFDYSRLLTERDGLLDFVTALLRDSHVLYVGFGLDDPSFNFMETRIHTRDGKFRPMSFAFVERAVATEHQTWSERGLQLIEVGNAKHMPDIISCINTIIAHVHWAERDRPAGADLIADRTETYMIDALEAYASGEFPRARDHARAALASTLFWPRSGEGALNDERARRLCQIRIRLALSHYKISALRTNTTDRKEAESGLPENPRPGCSRCGRRTRPAPSASGVATALSGTASACSNVSTAKSPPSCE